MIAEGDSSHVDDWDPQAVKSVITRLRPILKTWFRSEVRGLDVMPPGGALVVSNHSGGLYAVDVPVFAVDFYDKFGYDRPVFTLSNDIMFPRPAAGPLTRVGFIPASRANAATALRPGHRGGVPGRRLRRVSADVVGEQDPFRRAQGVCPNGNRDRRSDRSDGL